MFVEKLNRKQDGSIYVIEEVHAIINGKYEGYLEHDNANRATLKAYTGPKFTGEEISNVTPSVPSDTPWRTYVKVFANMDKIYITYETPGDTVEAEDINLLQEEAEDIKGNFELYKTSGHVDGGTF